MGFDALARQRADRVLRRGFLGLYEHNPRAGLAKGLGAGQSDPSPPAGDDGGLAVQPEPFLIHCELPNGGPDRRITCFATREG